MIKKGLASYKLCGKPDNCRHRKKKGRRREAARDKTFYSLSGNPIPGFGMLETRRGI